MVKVDPKEYSKYFFIAFFIILAYLSYLMVKPFFGAIVMSLLIAYAFFPLYKHLLKVVKNNNVAASIMTVGLLAVFLTPIILLLNIIIKQSISIYNKIDLTQVTNLFTQYTGGSLSGYIVPTLEKGVNYILASTSTLVLSIPQKVLAFFILIFILFFAFRESKTVVKTIKKSLPISEASKDKIANKFKQTIDGVIYGSIAVALVQGLFAAIGFWLLGVPSSAILGLITAIVAILPFLGPATVWVPLGIYYIYIGNTFLGIGILLYGAIILSLILDYIIKPKLISRKGKMHPITALLGVIGGISVFGISGLILGPFILSIFIFFIQMLIWKNAIKS